LATAEDLFGIEGLSFSGDALNSIKNQGIDNPDSIRKQLIFLPSPANVFDELLIEKLKLRLSNFSIAGKQTPPFPVNLLQENIDRIENEILNLRIDFGNILNIDNIFDIDIQTETPQITQTEDNTLRNALLIGGALLLIL